MGKDEETQEMLPTGGSATVSAVKLYMAMLDAGNAPPLDEFLSRHATIADELKPALEGLALVHRAADAKPPGVVAALDAEFTAKPIGDFQIVGELGRGGMGVVYEAIQLSLGRRVALKVLPFASGMDQVRLQRFRNEAHAAAALHHTNIVPVYAVGSDRGVHFYAMQLIEGQTLADVIASMRQANGRGDAAVQPTVIAATLGAKAVPAKVTAGQVAPSPDGVETTSKRTGTVSTVLTDSHSDRNRYYQSVVRMTQQAAIATEHAHQYGVVHRDIKPANLLLDSAGKIWVTDFGLAQIQQGDSNLTRTGDPMGTLRYMSPEQAKGDRAIIDHRTDIYSLGITLYELLTLEPAIKGEGHRDLLNQVAEFEPPTPKSIEPSLPIELDTIVRKAIAKSPTDRYPTAQAFADDLQRWLDDKPIAAKPPTALERLAKWRRRNSDWVAAASGVLLLATLGLLATTVLVLSQQKQTQQALERETEQRELAEENFQQALSAVERFSTLSESELAYRPELQDLRRSFLETSLEFYREFLDQHGDDPNRASELAATSQRVEIMVDELRVLDSVAPTMLLSRRDVQSELGIETAKANEIEEAIEHFRSERSQLANQFVGTFETDNQEMAYLLRNFDAYITEQLSDQQMKRLRQIARQRRLPFVFKSSEVVAALGLTKQQREAVSRIIEETRPNRGGPKNNGRRENPFPPRPGGPRNFDRPPPPPPDGRISQGGWPPEGFAGGRARDDDFGFGPDFSRTETTKNTVKHILRELTPQQIEKWNALVGEPF